jgi:predicted SAM-dependent methyltransferase
MHRNPAQAQRPSLRQRQYLNVGCGPFPILHFINLDYDWLPGVDLCWDLARSLPLQTASLRGVYSEHCIEHVSYEIGRFAIREFFRVLNPGGRVRIIVPDAGMFLDLYARAGHGEEVVFPFQTSPSNLPLVEVSRVFQDHGHVAAYDFDTLRLFLADAGFVDVQRRSFMNGQDPVMLIDRPERQPESLYVEAVHP